MAKSQKTDRKLIIDIAKKVIKTEIDSLHSLMKKSLDDNFIELINSILKTSGKVVLSGIGKSGIIAKKISATLVSTGTPSVFIHPVEALHGDIGLINKNDIVIVLSNSGSSIEVIKFAKFLKDKNIKVFSITNKANSKLSLFSYATILLYTKREACPHNLVPTSSTTSMLALGDAVAITLMKLKKYSEKDFAKVHPGGNIGRLIHLKVVDIMRKGKDNPKVKVDDTVEDAIKVMTLTSLGAVSIVDSKGKLKGFFTDGDIRRKISYIKLTDKISIHMTKNPIKIRYDLPIIEATKIIEEKKIDNLPVVDENDIVVGIIDEKDLIREGILF
ncbi:MAG: KpsF/GutQ family sugar-phosphate isomerase [Elusimicrobiales bacterium]|nr:KpsF/GutQ family sugar-phosphate isomerase [Elusimicrobiales bacterium]